MRGLLRRCLVRVAKIGEDGRHVIWRHIQKVFQSNIPGTPGWKEDITNDHLEALQNKQVGGMGREMRLVLWESVRETKNPGTSGYADYTCWKMLLADPDTEDDILVEMAQTGAWKETMVCGHPKATEEVWEEVLAQELSDSESVMLVNLDKQEMVEKYFDRIVAKRYNQPGVYFGTHLVLSNREAWIEAGVRGLLRNDQVVTLARLAENTPEVKEYIWFLGLGEEVVRKALLTDDKPTREWAIKQLPKMGQERAKRSGGSGSRPII